MNKINKIIAIVLLMSSTAILANDKSTLLMSEVDNGYNLDFLNTDGITGLQFDISFANKKVNKSALKSCVSGLPKSHTGSCTVLKNGNVRVIVFSTTNAILDSGSIGKINLNTGSVASVSINNVLMGTPDMKEIKGDVLLDLDRKKSLENKKF